jgi:hypothetical protein
MIGSGVNKDAILTASSLRTPTAFVEYLASLIE